MKSRGDHGSGGGGGCDARSESLAHDDLSVVVRPTATQERRDGTHHDIRGRGGRPGRHIWPRSHSGPAVGRGEPDDLGSPAGGAWRARSETGPTPPPAMILKSSQGIRLKSLHGSTAGGMSWSWQPVQTSTGSGEADQPG